jgi:hypothetical protein
VEGALYFNSTTDTSRVYNGTAWQNVAPVATTIDLATQVTGTLAAANGGTGITSPGTLGNVLTSTGTIWSSAPPAAGGLEYVVKTANYTTFDKEGVLADTSGGAFTVTLPATPATGAQVVVADSGSFWGTNNLTVGRNGSTIGGLAQDLVCDITGVSVQLVYDGSTWEVYSQIGGNGGTAVTLDGTQTLTNKTINGASNTVTNVPLSTGVTGTLPVANGGTGLTTLGTAAQILAVNSGATALEYVALPAGSAVVRVARTSNTILDGTNRGNLIDITSGTFSQTFTAAATLGNGWFAYVGNSGTGFVTLDPNSTETITVNGVAQTTWVLWPREMGLIVCNGSNFFYYNIQKGEITQTISTGVASVAFSTGLNYRRNMMLFLENVEVSTTGDSRLTISSNTFRDATYTVLLSNTTVTGDNANNQNIIGSGTSVASGTGLQRIAGTMKISVGTVETLIEAITRLTNDTPQTVETRRTWRWLTTNETNLNDITFTRQSGNYTAGTFILREV